MPLWKIHHPVGAYTAKDKEDFAKAITASYAGEMPAFYVVVLFDEVSGENTFVGGESRENFVRFEVDHLARAMPTRVMREFIVNMLCEITKPWVEERGYDWELTILELSSDLWKINGSFPPPFRSPAERRWRQENKPTPYDWFETVGTLADGSLDGLATGLNRDPTTS